MKSILMMAAMMLISGTVLAQSKVVYVDMQRAVSTTKAGGKAKKELETEFNAKKKKLQGQEEKLKKMQEDLEKKAMVLSDEVRGKKQQEFQQEMMEYQKLVAQSQQEIQKREQDLSKPILEKMSKIIEQISKEKGYDLVLEKQGNNVLWAKKEVDITDDVVSGFEKAK